MRVFSYVFGLLEKRNAEENVASFRGANTRQKARFENATEKERKKKI